MSQRKIASVIVAYNNYHDVDILMQKLRQIDYGNHVIIIVDNTDDESLAYPGYDDVVYQKTGQNSGSASGFAMGMQLAYDCGADWIWLHDQDGYPYEGCLDALLNVNLDNDLVILAPVIIDECGEEMVDFRCKSNAFLAHTGVNITDDIVNVDSLGTAGIFVNRAVIDKIGVYDGEHFFVGWEDFEYSLRAKKNGVQLLAVKAAKYHHPNWYRKYNIKSHAIKKFIHNLMQDILPPFIGCMRQGNYRDKRNVCAYMYILKTYASGPVYIFDMMYSIFRLCIGKCFSKDVSVWENLRLYYQCWREK